MTPRYPASFVRKAARLLMPVLLVGAAQAQPPQEAMPVHDRTLTAPNPQQDSHFGYTMTGGKVDPPFNDTMDDLAVCAPHENEGAQEDVSAIYLYLNSSLDLAPGAKLAYSPRSHTISAPAASRWAFWKRSSEIREDRVRATSSSLVLQLAESRIPDT